MPCTRVSLLHDRLWSFALCLALPSKTRWSRHERDGPCHLPNGLWHPAHGVFCPDIPQAPTGEEGPLCQGCDPSVFASFLAFIHPCIHALCQPCSIQGTMGPQTHLLGTHAWRGPAWLRAPLACVLLLLPVCCCPRVTHPFICSIPSSPFICPTLHPPSTPACS